MDLASNNGRASSRRRRLGMVGLAALLAAGLAACGGSSSATSTKSTATTSGGSTSGPSSTSAAPAVRHITIGTAGATGYYGPVYLAQQTNIWAKYHLTATLKTLTPSACDAAVVNGNVDVCIEGPGLVAAALKTNGADKIVMAFGYVAFYLFAKPGITSISQLKGQTVGATTPGGAIDQAVRGALTKAGLTPGKDVNISYVNTNTATLAALEAGRLAAGGVSPPTNIEAEKAHLTDLGSIAKDTTIGPIGMNTAFAKAHPNAAQDFVSAMVDAVKTAKSDPTDTEKAVGVYTKVTSQSILQASYAAQKSLWLAEPFPTSQMQTLFNSLAATVPAAKTASPSSVIDNTYIDKAVSG